jgi:tetratricopeptide (TPR) repeat protein
MFMTPKIFRKEKDFGTSVHGDYTIFSILKNDVDFYNAEKHRLPCMNCIDKFACFREIKNDNEYIIYTVGFEKLCIEAIISMDHILRAKSGLKTSLKKIDKMSISELFNNALTFYGQEDPRIGLTDYTGFVMFVSVVLRDANYIHNMKKTAYHYLGRIYELYDKCYQHAIDLYSKAINLTPKDHESFMARGFCFLKTLDLKNAIDDFKKVNELCGKFPLDLKNVVDDVNKRQRGLNGNSKYDHLYNYGY